MKFIVYFIGLIVIFCLELFSFIYFTLISECCDEYIIKENLLTYYAGFRYTYGFKIYFIKS